MYNREYISKEQETNEQSVVQPQMNFLSETFKIFGASIMAGAVGAWLAIPFAENIGVMGILVLLVVEIGLIIGINKVSDTNSQLAFGMLGLFGLISGVAISPLLAIVMSQGLGSLIGEAFLMTSVIYFALGYFALTTKMNLTSERFGKLLFAGLIALIIGGVVNLFVGNSFASLFMAWGGAILFSGFILYDIQGIAKGMYANPISAALSLYLNFINLFTSILRILLASNSED